MGDENYRSEFIKANLPLLTKSTVIGIELVVNLFSKGLINNEEKELLTDRGISSIERADLLYTRVANKWIQSQFEQFKMVLKDTGNSTAFQVFTADGADMFLTTAQVQLLKEQRDKREGGGYEGISHEDEMKANKLIEILRGHGMFAVDGKLSAELNRKEVVPLVKHFEDCLKNKIIWWNPRKPPLPKNYFERRVARTEEFIEKDRDKLVKLNLLDLVKSTVIGPELVAALFEKKLIDDSERDKLLDSTRPNLERAIFLYLNVAMRCDDTRFEDLMVALHKTGNIRALQVFTNAGAKFSEVAPIKELSNDGTLPSTDANTSLIELVSCDLIDCDDESRVGSLLVLVDPPGMGKSSEMSNLELKLRMKITRNRIVLRVNLNEVQRELANLSPSESASSVLLKLAPFIPSTSLETVGFRLFLLFDGLDEVCPKHENAMIKFLRILTLSEDKVGSIHVVVTTRPHLRAAMEQEFKLKSWSLLPVSKEDQNEYIKSMLGVSDKELSEIWCNLTPSIQDLLGNPLMLSMFVDVIKSGGTFSGAGDVNIFERYTRFMASKHVLHLVEKEGMGAENSSTDTRLRRMLEENSPYYYRVAITELFEYKKHSKDILSECEGIVIVAQVEPFGATRDDLISIGFVIEDRWNGLVFKHRSFAEFFYAKLLTLEECVLPQNVRDTLFGNTCARVYLLENVEAFVEASVSRTRLARGESDAFSLVFPLTHQWILIRGDFDERLDMLDNFIDSPRLFPLFVREVLRSFVDADADDLWEAQKVLLHKRSEVAFKKLFLWMTENRDWVRGELLKINQFMTTTTPMKSYCPLPVARLMVAIGLRFKDQMLLTEEEVSVGVNCCDNRLVYIVATFQHEERKSVSKWDFVEGHMSRGRSQLRELFLQIKSENLCAVIEDTETAWKLVEILSHEEICALVTNQETRVSDIIGERPREVVTVLGEEFVPRKHLAEFRVKFQENNQGKTVFEMSDDACGFAVEYLWEDLVGEMQREDSSGHVGVAVREALVRMGGDSWKLLEKLRIEVQRTRGRSCLRIKPNGSANQRENKNQDCDKVGGIIEWVTHGLPWSADLTLDCFKSLPLVLRSYGNVDNLPATLTKYLIQLKKHSLFDSSELMALLQSLVLVSSPPSQKDSLLASFLREQLEVKSILPYFRSLVRVFLGSTREQIAEAPFVQLVREVCIGGVALNLLSAIQQPTTITVDMDTWEIISRDIIEFTPCCALPAVLQDLRQQIGENEEELKKVLTSRKVFGGWIARFSSKYRREEQHVETCAVRNILFFYFSIFGVNCRWMNMNGWCGYKARTLVESLPVEIVSSLRASRTWTHLLPEFQQMLQEREAVYVGVVAEKFSYKTEAEWEVLLPLINGEGLLRGFSEYKYIPISVSAPHLIRALYKLYGLEWTKSRLTRELWRTCTTESLASLGSYLYSAVQLGELEKVKRCAWPGVVSWRNAEGKTALEIARESYDETHPIRIHLEQCTRNRPKEQN